MIWIAILLLMLFVLWRLDRHAAKELLRRTLVRTCRDALRLLSPPYTATRGPAVVFAPHQDDETLGCGALIARQRYEGLPVHVVFITDGSASHPDHPRLSSSAITAIRRHEAREALGILGVESCAIHFLDAKDGKLNELDRPARAALVERITALMNEVRPREIFLPCCPDGSSEHDAAFSFICEALQQTRLPLVVWEYPVWSWWNPLLLLVRVIYSRGRCRQPTEDFQFIKNRALARYRSQIAPLAPDTIAALPPELVSVFQTDAEFFFRYDLPPLGRRLTDREDYNII